MNPPTGYVVLNRQSPQFRGLAEIMSPYLAPGIIGLGLPSIHEIQIWRVHSSGVTYVTQPGFGLVTEFDGNLGNIKGIPASAAGGGFFPTGPITIGWWMRKDGDGGAGQGRIFQSDETALIYFNSSACIFVDRRWDTTSGDWRSSQNSIAANDSIPKHVVWTYNTDVADDPICYLNGIAQPAVNEVVTPVGSPTRIGNATYNIGNNNDSGVRGWDGTIWDWRVYNRMFSPEEVRQWHDEMTRFDLYSEPEQHWAMVEEVRPPWAAVFQSRNQFPVLGLRL